MAYDEQIKDQILAGNDIVDVISQYIPLKKSGRNLKACCPFHQEKTPSFMVNTEKQIFRCFGCGAGGDVFTFMMRFENLSFPEALKFLADRARITLPASYTKDQNKSSGENEKLYEIYRLAAAFYHQEFLHPERGRVARDYFYQRNYDETIAKEFQMGWAPEGWRNLLEHLSKKGFPEDLLIKAGLIHRSEKGTLYDAFRERLLFPIHNLQGKIVAFGGRILSKGTSDGPKYLNSPDSPIFHKRRELFGLYLAKKFINSEKPQLLITEGYFDFLRLYQGGFKYTVATLGTALTEDHVTLLKRYAEEAVVIYDGDSAGQAASLRGLEVFLEGGMNVKLVRMPAGYDPDDFLLKEGASAFQKLIDTAKDFFDYKLEILLERYNRRDALGLTKITGDFLETLVKVKNQILLDLYLKRLSSALGVDLPSLRGELVKYQQKMRPREERKVTGRVTPSDGTTEKKRPPSFLDEVLFLSLIMEETSFAKQAVETVAPDLFEDPEVRDIFEQIILLVNQGQTLSWAQVLSRISDPELKQKLMELTDLEWASSEDKRKGYQDSLFRLKKKQRERQLEALRDEIMSAERKGEMDLVRQLASQYQGILRNPVQL